MKKSHILSLNYLKNSALLFISAIFIAPQLAAQEVPYTPFPKGNISWQCWGSRNPEIYPTLPYVLSIDTALVTMDNKVYNKVFYDKNTNHEQYIGGIREEYKKIYLYAPGFGEHLIYDFGLEIGDTLFNTIAIHISPYANGDLNVYFLSPNDSASLAEPTHYVVRSKGIRMLENGESRNTLIVDRYYYPDGYYFAYEWIEGLGAIFGSGFLEIVQIPLILPSEIFILSCICQNSSRLYNSNNAWGFECSLCAGSQINENLQHQISITPNPTTGKLKIENGELRIKNIEVFDCYGRKQKVEYRMQNVIDISHLSVGIYFVKIITEQGSFIEKIIMK